MGFLSVLLFVLIGSAQDVFLGNLFTSYDPVLVAFLTFSIATIFLALIALSLRQNKVQDYKAQLRNLIFLNLVTALNWLSFFVSLRYIEPAIVGAISFSIGPGFSAIIEKVVLKKKETKILYPTLVVLSCIFLSYVAIDGKSAFIVSDKFKVTLGVVLAVLSGLGMVLNTYISKSLSSTNLTTLSITSARFIAISLASLLFLLFNNISIENTFHDLHLMPSIIGIAVIGIMLPMLLIQYGIKHSEPLLVSLLLSLTPATTFLLEFFDKRLQLNYLSALGIFLCCFFTILGILKENKKAVCS